MNSFSTLALSLATTLILTSCASYDKVNSPMGEKYDHSDGINIYLVGDAGKFEDGKVSPVLSGLNEKLSLSGKNDVLLFLGDNIYPNGMPAKKTDPTREAAEKSLRVQIDAAASFNGSVFFIPGNHDWYSGVKGLAEQQKIVEKAFGKNSFLPSSGCPLDKYEVTDDIVIIFIDTEWYITNWNRHPDINDDCEIRTREDFLQEFKSLVNKNQNKTIVLAMHHPLETNGSHGGQYPFNLLKLPLNFLLKTSGASPADRNFPVYRELSNKITTILQNHANHVIVVSGHDHNLQYLEVAGIPQVISGSGSKSNAVRHFRKDTTTYGYGGLGYAALHLRPDQNEVVFYDQHHKVIHARTLTSPLSNQEYQIPEFPTSSSVKASIYFEDDPKKTHRFSSTEKHMYRGYYYNLYDFPVVSLDTLFGGLKPVKLGGGNQSVSLRLRNSEGKQYVMRRLRKSASQFIQAKIFTEKYVKDKIEGSGASTFLMDFYTSSYPFAPLVLGELSDVAGVYHANAKIYYVPKQNALGQYNEVLGDELYLIEEHLSDEHKQKRSFGNTDDIVSSDDVLKDLIKDEKYKIDHQQYIRTRLFDMWIGDWDRHEDQYKWAATENADGTITYAPIPRDRDQAFPKFGNFFTKVIAPVIPPLQSMQTFEDDIKNVITFNTVIYRLDKTMIHDSEHEEWMEAARYLESTLTDELIDKAFMGMPDQFSDATLATIKDNLKLRRKHISSWAAAYYAYLNKHIIVTGTDKDDQFTVTRLPNGQTHIHVARIKDDLDANDILFNKTFSDRQTKEIWLYGLDEKDQFLVEGDSKTKIKVRLIGGQDHDAYTIENPRKVNIYDYKSKKSTIIGKGVRTWLTDLYALNNYNFYKYVHHTRMIMPAIAFNPDEGVIVGAAAQFITYGFDNNPFTNKHTLGAGFFTASNGFAVRYTGEFAHALWNNNFKVESFYTTPAFSQNFFGYGNETTITTNEEFQVYYRTRLERLKLKLSLINKGRLGTEWRVSLPLDYYHPSSNEGRFVEDYFQPEDLEPNYFAGLESSFFYQNKNEKTLSTQGMSFSVSLGWKQNLERSKSNFGYMSSTLQVDYPLVRSHRLSLSTAWHIHALSNNSYEFYQAAVLGGRYGLRGYRNQRFSGKTAYYQNTDLRLSVLDFNAGILPATLGVYGGFDYGRVWLNTESSNRWHLSYGGGLFVNSLSVLTVRASLFVSDEGSRFVFGLGFDF